MPSNPVGFGIAALMVARESSRNRPPAPRRISRRALRQQRLDAAQRSVTEATAGTARPSDVVVPEQRRPSPVRARGPATPSAT
jgi:hypothetical protein